MSVAVRSDPSSHVGSPECRQLWPTILLRWSPCCRGGGGGESLGCASLLRVRPLTHRTADCGDDWLRRQRAKFRSLSLFLSPLRASEDSGGSFALSLSAPLEAWESVPRPTSVLALLVSSSYLFLHLSRPPRRRRRRCRRRASLRLRVATEELRLTDCGPPWVELRTPRCTTTATRQATRALRLPCSGCDGRDCDESASGEETSRPRPYRSGVAWCAVAVLADRGACSPTRPE